MVTYMCYNCAQLADRYVDLMHLTTLVTLMKSLDLSQNSVVKVVSLGDGL
jgi:hypothetical protein